MYSLNPSILRFQPPLKWSPSLPLCNSTETPPLCESNEFEPDATSSNRYCHFKHKVAGSSAHITFHLTTHPAPHSPDYQAVWLRAGVFGLEPTTSRSTEPFGLNYILKQLIDAIQFPYHVVPCRAVNYADLIEWTVRCTLSNVK